MSLAYRGRYDLRQNCGPTAFPMPYPTMTTAFVVVRFVCPAVVEATQPRRTTKGAMEVTAGVCVCDQRSAARTTLVRS